MMTNLGITKEEIIYQLVVSLNKSPVAEDTGWGIVRKAVNEYDELVERGIIVEEEPKNKETPQGDLNVRMYDVATHPAEVERVNVYDKSGMQISSIDMWKPFKSNTMPKQGYD